MATAWDLHVSCDLLEGILQEVHDVEVLYTIDIDNV